MQANNYCGFYFNLSYDVVFSIMPTACRSRKAINADKTWV